MSPSDTLFDADEAIARREAGMARAAAARPALLEQAQRIAVALARTNGIVTSDDVAARMLDFGMDYTLLGNASGSVFRGKFVWTGGIVMSKRVSTHGRAIKVWRLKEANDEV